MELHHSAKFKLINLFLDKSLVDVEFSPDGTILVLGFRDNIFKLWDVASGKEVRTFGEEYITDVNTFALSPDGKTLASSSSDGLIHIWDVSAGEHLRTISGHNEVMVSGAKVAFSPDGKMLVSIALDGVKFWDVASGTERVPEAISGYFAELDVTFNNFISGHDITIAPNGKYMATAGDWVMLWKISP